MLDCNTASAIYEAFFKFYYTGVHKRPYKETGHGGQEAAGHGGKPIYKPSVGGQQYGGGGGGGGGQGGVGSHQPTYRP